MFYPVRKIYLNHQEKFLSKVDKEDYSLLSVLKSYGFYEKEILGEFSGWRPNYRVSPMPPAGIRENYQGIYVIQINYAKMGWEISWQLTKIDKGYLLDPPYSSLPNIVKRTTPRYKDARAWDGAIMNVLKRYLLSPMNNSGEIRPRLQKILCRTYYSSLYEWDWDNGLDNFLSCMIE